MKSTESELSALYLEAIGKHFGAKPVVDDLNLTIAEGEFVSLLGASGCGKTTTLRMVAGLERPDVGVLRFGTAVWASPAQRRFVAPQDRSIGMVFQSYALWPHMTVFENVAYPMRIRGRPTGGVAQILELVHLDALADRSAARLSGGQQQRVALARALACEPSLLLLDEPFSNLDVSLRQKLRIELRAIQRRLGLTVILVTHDQADAFELSDRIAVMRDGRIEQCADAESIYERPATPFVRDFVGSTVLFPARIEPAAQCLRVQLVDGDSVELPATAASVPITAATDGYVSVRPEDLMVSQEPMSGAVLLAQGKVTGCVYAGSHLEIDVRTRSGRDVSTQVPRSARVPVDATVHLYASQQALRAWPAEGNLPNELLEGN